MSETTRSIDLIIVSLKGGSEDGEKTLGLTWQQLGLDSLETLDLLVRVEEEFGITIADEAAASLFSPGDLMPFLEAAPGSGKTDQSLDFQKR